jgi:predicted GNAT family acetyltransferase
MLITHTNDPDDLDIITMWWYQEWKQTYIRYGYDTFQKARDYVTQQVRNNSLTVFVAREGPIIVSTAAIVLQYNPVVPSANKWIANVYTPSEYRKCGYGTNIINEILRRRTGEDTIYLTCKDTHIPWYHSLGFKIHSRGDEDVIMYHE